MTPRQSRAARALLDLSIRSVCEHADIGLRTLTEFEAGKRTLNHVTEAKLLAFYQCMNILMIRTAAGNETVTLQAVDHLQQEHRALKQDPDLPTGLGIEQLCQELDQAEASVSQLCRHVDFSARLLKNSMRVSGLNQKQLAAQVGCSPAFVNLILAGKKRLSPALADALAALTGASGEQLRQALGFETRAKRQLASVNKILRGIRDDAGRIVDRARR